MSIYPYRNWTPEEDNLLRDLMATKKYSFRQMAKHFVGRTPTSLRKHALNHLGLRHDDFVFRKHSYNRTFFETPNPINCYVAGYYAADGCIQDNPTTRVITLSLAAEDGNQVETFKHLLGYSGKVCIDPRKRGQDTHSLRLYGAHQMAADLERNFGLTINKTHRLPPPKLADAYLQFCYLIGLLDGDGCVHLTSRDYLIITYVSCSYSIVNWVKTLVDSLKLTAVRANRSSDVRLECNAQAYRYTIGGAKAVDLICRAQALKSEGVPILDRKWDNPRINAYIDAFEVKHDLKLRRVGSISPSVTDITVSPLVSTAAPSV